MMKGGRAMALRASLKRNGSAEVALRGRCMEPFLREGDVARVAPTGSCRKGDLCLIQMPAGELAVHRVVKVGDGRLVTKGDYSGRAELVGADAVIGTVVALMLQGAGREVAYDPGAASRRLICFLSCRVALSRTRFMRHAARAAVWRLGCWQRERLLRASAR